MTLRIQNYKKILLAFFLFIIISSVFGQRDTDKFRLQFSIGLNNPIDDGKNDGYYSKSLNFPTVNLGFQYMFKRELGAKLDFGFNRAASADGSLEFKLNYSRVNAQIVYDFTNVLHFMPEQMLINIHGGPGISFTKPLGNASENKYTYLNGLIGLELHYRISRTLSLFGDLAYAKGFSGKNKYDIVSDGFSFNGNLVYATIGLSVALSGCRYCN